MSKPSDPGESVVGRGLPGTGGDLTPTDLDHDVEGHSYHGGSTPDAPKPGEGVRAIPTDAEDGKDVEGPPVPDGSDDRRRILEARPQREPARGSLTSGPPPDDDGLIADGRPDGVGRLALSAAVPLG